MTKKITHKDYVDYNFSLIGICTQEADYKICHLLNREFEIDFERINDIEILLPKQGNVVKFACFKFIKKWLKRLSNNKEKAIKF